jgi:hypothetical protein
MQSFKLPFSLPGYMVVIALFVALDKLVIGKMYFGHSTGRNASSKKTSKLDQVSILAQ